MDKTTQKLFKELLKVKGKGESYGGNAKSMRAKGYTLRTNGKWVKKGQPTNPKKTKKVVKKVAKKGGVAKTKKVVKKVAKKGGVAKAKKAVGDLKCKRVKARLPLTAKQSAWINRVKAYQAAHPGMKYIDALKGMKGTQADGVLLGKGRRQRGY
jgi:hypothetical protein